MNAKIPTPAPQKPKPDAQEPAAKAGPVAQGSTYVAIGKVGKPHGLRGAFFVANRSEPIPSSYGELWIGADVGVARPTRVRASHMQADRPLLLCTLAEHRSGAEALTGLLIFAERSRIKLRPGEMLWSDLEGVAVVDVHGVTMGRVHHVYNAGSCDIVELRSGARSVDIPLIDAYLAPGQALDIGRGTLQLQVAAEVFDDVWQDQTKRPAADGDA